MTPTIRPTIKQDKFWQLWQDDRTRYPLFGGGAGGGKTWCICEISLTQCYQYPGIKSFIARKELKRLMQSAFITFSKVCAHHKIPQGDWHLDGKYNVIVFNNGSKIDLLDCDFLPSDPLFERFGSLEYTNGFVEEAGEIQALAFDVLKTRVGRHRNEEFNLLGKIGLTANPTKNFLYRTFYKPWKAGELPPDYAFIQALYSDNPHTADIYGQQLSSISDRATRERLMIGNWDYDDDPATLIPFEAITDLESNTVQTGSPALIVDVARFGQDRTVFTRWDGREAVNITVRQKQSTEATEQEIKKMASENRIPYSRIVVDEDGVGGGIVDHLPGVKGFVANSRAINDANFANLKSQCAFTLAEEMKKRALRAKLVDVSIKDSLHEELSQLRAKNPDKDAKLRVEPKDEMKERLGRSPDLLDTFIMRMYLDLLPQQGAPVQSRPAFKPYGIRRPA